MARLIKTLLLEFKSWSDFFYFSSSKGFLLLGGRGPFRFWELYALYNHYLKFGLQISQDTGKYCFGVDDTLRALEMGAVETLICWENLDVQRYTLKNNATGESKILHLSTDQVWNWNGGRFYKTYHGVIVQDFCRKKLVLKRWKFKLEDNF